MQTYNGKRGSDPGVFILDPVVNVRQALQVVYRYMGLAQGLNPCIN